ncbi:MAG: DUF2752 domain-containing protein [Bergeyella zoohelcum]|nr:DUF2752 domain-containing protein [Bergeyella zoohelcum]
MKNKKLAILLAVVMMFLAGLYYRYNPASSHTYFPSCPTYSILGIYCPGCGTQRAFHYLLHGDITMAFRFNPLFVVFIPLILVLVVQYLLPIFTEKRWEIPLFRNNVFLYFLFFLLCIYFILRNIPFDFFDALRPPIIKV